MFKRCTVAVFSLILFSVCSHIHAQDSRLVAVKGKVIGGCVVVLYDANDVQVYRGTHFKKILLRPLWSKDKSLNECVRLDMTDEQIEEINKQLITRTRQKINHAFWGAIGRVFGSPPM